jgi:hypothetical protein
MTTSIDTGDPRAVAAVEAIHRGDTTRLRRLLAEHPELATAALGTPVRLHDLRHGAATLAHAAGADLKTVQEQLGHTRIVLTADTYTSVLLELHFKVAEATARLVLKAAARHPGHRYRSKIGPPKSAAPVQPRGRNPCAPSDPAKRSAPARAAHL